MVISSDSVVRALALTTRTYFEIRGLCEAQNRALRPWLEAVPQQITIFPKTGGGPPSHTCS
ncbi:hypothetical protein LNA01_04930 [Companilactobacillus nantensis]|nr:hypothetical protein LNA01_04930 [Companilactobacillus nantensis]